MRNAIGAWSGAYRHGLAGGVWLKGAFVPDQHLKVPPVTSYDYDILVAAAETVWMVRLPDTDVVGLTVTLSDTEPPPPAPTRELARLHPLESATARVYSQTTTVMFSEPAKLYVAAIDRIDLDVTPNPDALKKLAIPPGDYFVRAHTWQYVDDGAYLADGCNADVDTPADALPVQVRLDFWTHGARRS